MNIEEVENRFEELYRNAVNRYLDKTDFDIDEWLSDKEQKEFHRLELELGYINEELYNEFYK